MSRVEQLEAALLKAHRAGDRRGAQAIANEVKRVRAEGEDVGVLDSLAAGVSAGYDSVNNAIVRGGAKLGEWLGVPGAAESGAKMDTLIAGRTARDTKYRQAHPNWVTAGELIGQTPGTLIATTGAGGALVKGGGAIAKVAPPVGNLVQNVGRATVASGFADVGAVSRAIGGALSGALSAAMTGGDAKEGAGIGALLPTGTSLVSGSLGTLVDYATGRFGKTRAAEILRNEVAGRIDEVKAALEKGGENARRNVAEFLAAKGIDIPELSALVVDLEKSTSNAPLLAVAGQRADDIAGMQAGLRGGATATEAQTARQFGKMGLNDATAPMREAPLARADIGRTVIAPAEAEAQRMSAAALDEVARARHLLPMADSMIAKSATGAVEPDLAHISMLKTPEQLRAGELANVAEAHGSDAADLSLDYGNAGRTAQEMADNLRAQGLQPLDIGAVTSRLRAEAEQAQHVNPDRFRLLSRLAKQLDDRAAQFGGVIDATGLYEFRKNLGANVESLLGARTGETLKKRTAELVGEVQPLIDNAIETAGGDGWSQYLKTFSSGMRDLERKKFAATLADMPEEKVVEVMAGKHPDVVEKFFGPGRFNINVELMGGKLPQAQKLASEYKAGHDVTAMGMGGISPDKQARLMQGVSQRTQNAMAPGLPNVFMRGAAGIAGGHMLPFGGRAASAQVEQAYANKLYESVRNHLASGLASPAETRAMLELFSTPQMTRQLMESNPLLMRGAQGATINAFAQPTEYQY